jgi:hypothetical protein
MIQKVKLVILRVLKLSPEDLANLSNTTQSSETKKHKIK